MDQSFGDDLLTITWAGDDFLAMGTSQALFSSDGAVWADFVSDDLTDVIWDGQTFLGITQPDTLLTSVDGLSWTEATAPSGSSLEALTFRGD